MRRLGDILLRAAKTRDDEPGGGNGRYLALLLVLGAGAGLVVPGCGDDTEAPTGATTTTATTGTGGAGGAGGTGGDPTTTSSSGTAGGGGVGGATPYECNETATGTTRGAAIAVSPDDSIVVSVNRDVGTVSVISVDYADGPAMTKTVELDVGAGSEPWQVAIDACGKRAYVILRKDQRVITIDDLDTTPVLGASVSVGSEPTGLALTPNNTNLYVANWVDGTLSRINPATMTLTSTVDLNTTLVDTGLLGAIAPRAALAHPRALAITNDADGEDNDETVYVTEWYAQRTAPESADGKNSDTNKRGYVYKVPVEGAAPSTIELPPVMSTGFLDKDNNATGCFPNQVGSITIEGQHAYVTSTCASPVGPIGVFIGAGVCTIITQESVCGSGGTCDVASIPAKCNPNTRGVKTTTHPAVSIIALADGTATTTVLDQLFVGKASARMPLLPTDIGFFNNFAYVSSLGADAVFRLTVTDGVIADVGSATNDFIDVRIPGEMPPQIRTPIGIATGHTQAFAFVANDGTRDVTALAFNAQAIAVGAAGDDYRVIQSTALPAPGSDEEKVLKGKRFFNTGLGRWSLAGEAWGSCAACHIDGLSDNVTWYFARGPRQSVSLDGSYASGDDTDQRIFNWTGIFDEVADFEGNTRGISGGLGAIVNPANTRIDTANQVPPQQGLQGSSNEIADPMGTSPHPHSVLSDFLEIDEWIKTIRSPRKPSNLVQADVDAGRVLFSTAAQANCVGCHSGPKWTISTRFYAPGDIPNAATNDAAATSLSNVSWNVNLNGFPPALFPIKGAADPLTQARMRFGAPPGAEQLQCILRPVGTFGVSSDAVATVELRQDMITAGQGNADTGAGFNPPSLLGMQVAGPYFHAGNARTLEEVFDAKFLAHHQSAIAQVFSPDATEIRQLVAYLLAIDEDEAVAPIPPKGATGGDLCFYP